MLRFWPDGAPDGFDLQDMLEKHGLIEETVATAEDAKQPWARDVGIEAGDRCYKLTALGKRARAAAKEQ